MSFGCVLIGWIVMVAYLFWRYYAHAEVSPRWYSMPLAIAGTSWKYVGPTWALLVLPLFILVRPDRRLWGFLICGPLLATAGFLIMASISRFNYAYPFGLLWLLAAICGGATGVASSFVQRSLTIRNQEAEQGGDGDA